MVTIGFETPKLQKRFYKDKITFSSISFTINIGARTILYTLSIHCHFLSFCCVWNVDYAWPHTHENMVMGCAPKFLLDPSWVQIS